MIMLNQFRIRRVRPGKYSEPGYWKKVVEAIPDIRPLFLNQLVLDTPKLRQFFKDIPYQCPFNKAFELVHKPSRKGFLICFIPKLCTLNPFYNWIIDLKMEIILSDNKVKDLSKIAVMIEDDPCDIPSVQSILEANIKTK